MENKIIICLILLSLFNIGFISASRLCIGNDGYYHDCDDNRYFNSYDRNYDNYYYYRGDYYPTRDYYYREYYRPRSCGSRCNKEDGLTYKDTEEYKRTIEYNYEDRGISENIKYSINEKTQTNLHYDNSYLRYYSNYNNMNNNQNSNNRGYNDNYNTNTGYWYNLLYDVEPVPYSSGWYNQN